MPVSHNAIPWATKSPPLALLPSALMPGLSQNDVFLFAVVAIAIVVVCYFSFRKSRYLDLVDHPPDDSPGLHLGGSYPREHRPTQEERDAADAEFDEVFYNGIWHFVDRYFHTKIAGASHRNDDGSSRIAAIQHCKPSELLIIQWDKGNRYDRYAKMVKRQNGEQLGYLQREIAADIHDDFFIPGVTWMGIFKCPTRHPETGEVVGAVVLLARKTPEKAAKAEAKIREAQSQGL